MKQVLMIGAVLLIAAMNFVMYCCIRVGAREDRLMEEYRMRKEQEGDDD